MGQEAQRLVKNFLSLTVGVFFVRLLTVVATLYVARALGPTEFGPLSFGLSLTLVFTVAANLGMDDLIVREVARWPDTAAATVGDALIVKSILALPLVLCVTLLAALYNPSRVLLFFVLVVYTLFNSFLEFLCAVFRGLERMEYQTLLLSLRILLVAMGAILAAHLTADSVVVAVAYLLPTWLVAAGGYILLREKGLRPIYRWHPPAWKPLLLTALPFGLIYISFMFYDRLPTIAVATLVGDTASGWFNSVYNLVLALITIPYVVVTALFPLLARKSQSDARAVAPIVATVAKHVTLLGVGMAIGLNTIAAWLVLLLFEEAYRPSIRILQILAFSLPFMFLDMVLIVVLEATNHQKTCVRGIAYASLAALPLSFVATQRWGYLGGAWAYVTIHAILALILFVYAHRAMGRLGLLDVFSLPLLAGTAMGLPACLGRNWPLPVLVLAMCASYGLIVLAYTWLRPAELILLRRLWRERRAHDAAPTGVAGDASPHAVE